MDAKKTAAFAERDPSTESARDRAFLIDNPEKVWVVTGGSVDLFLVEMAEAGAPGSRHHLVRIKDGQAIFGLRPLPGSGVDLLADPGPGAKVLEMMAEQFEAECVSSGGAGLRHIDQWIEALASIAAEAAAPSRFRKLEPGETFSTGESPVAVLPTSGVVWIRQLEGRSALLGNDALGQIGPREIFPVTRLGWLEASAASRIETFSIDAFPSLGASRNGLEKAHSLIFAYILQLHTARGDHACRRLAAQAAADQAVVDAALQKLAAPLTGDKQVLMESEGGAEDPLTLACQAVGRAMRMRIRAAPKSDKSRERDPVAGIARVSRIRHRQVILRGGWWHKEGGPLVGFLGEPKDPVALLPGSDQHYHIFNPARRSEERITPEIASQINAVAYTFYRPFPERPMDLKGVAGFGLAECRRELLMVGLMGLAVGLLALVTPVLTGIIFDSVIPGAQRSTLADFTLFLVVAAIATAMFSLTRSLATLRLEGKLDAALQAAVWDRLLALPVPFFRRFTAGDLARRSLGISQIRQTLTGPALTSMLSGIFSIPSLALMFYYSWRLAVIGALVVGLAFIVFLVLGYVQVRFLRESTDLSGKISGMTLQFINGINKFRVAGAEERAFAAWAQEFARKKQLTLKVRNLGAYLEVFNAAFQVVSVAMIFYFAAQLMIGGGTSAMSTGEFLAFNAAFMQLSFAMINLSTAATSVLSVVPLYERAKPILQTAPETHAAWNDPGPLAGGIEINHVNFRYREDGPLVLRDVSVSIAAGEFVAFVGPSGSGKSTLFRLLLGFESPESGAIYYDGQALAEIDVQSVRRQIGVVLQNGKLMTGDIYRNIVGSSALGMEDAWEAARMAGLDEDIKAMPMGMHTMVSESGGLSGGQRQRLMIARAIVNRPRILLFDEATSALDNQTQAIVSRSLEQLNATRVVIAHRLTTVQHATRIYVLDKGVVAESGSYADLMAKDGLFSRLARRQLT